MALVYFSAAIRGDVIAKKVVTELINYIQNDLRVLVLSQHVGAEDPKQSLLKFLRADPEKLSPAEFESLVEEQDTEWVNECTHLVAEVSGASTGVGVEIGHARLKHLLGYPPAKILCLYKSGSQPSAMITGMRTERWPQVRVASYRDIEHAKILVADFLRDTD